MPNRLISCALIAVVAGFLGAISQGLWLPQAWWLQILSLTLLYGILFARDVEQTSARQAFALTFIYGLTYFCLGVGWLYISMHRYGGMVAPLAAIGVVLLSSLLASFSALAAALAVRLTGASAHFGFGRAPLAAILLFAAAWALMEWTRSWIFSGFPWVATGYSQLDGPLAAAAPVFGVYGLSLLTGLVAGGLALSLARAQLRQFSTSGLACMAMALSVSFALTHLNFTTATGRSLTVRLVQGNIAQDMKFDPALRDNTLRYFVAQVAHSKASLTVLPETAWTTLWERTPPDIAGDLLNALASSGTTLAMGLPARNDGDIYNSIAVMNSKGQFISRYDKRHLVPFGEFVPPGFRWFVDQMRIPLGDFGRGKAEQDLLRQDGQWIGFNICYEDLFGEELAEQVRRGAQILINVSNIAWFGDSHALAQHLSIARMRATNTGVTASIGADGKVIALLPNYQAANLDVPVAGSQGLTPYARFGNGLFLAAAALLVAIGAFLSWRHRG
jgi:apolipoprotein N-acyltransferase